jgi:RPE4 domain-containing protein
LALNIPYFLNSTVIDLDSNKILTIASKEWGLQKIKSEAIIVATGCRERTREKLEVPGARPSGVYTAGQAQNIINLKGYRIGKNVIIQGSGDIGLIMARRLTIEGYHVIKVLEKLPYLSGLLRNKIQCLDDFDIPLELNSEIVEIVGDHRVRGVQVKNDKNKTAFIPCDTVLFSVGLIPELDIAKKADKKGLFICGNALHIHDLADNASKEGDIVANNVFQYLADKNSSLSGLQKLPSSRGLTAGSMNYNITTLLDPAVKPRDDGSLYKPRNNGVFNEDFFTSFKNNKQTVCLVCPRGCVLTENKYPCPNGKLFFEQEQKEKLRSFTTTITINKKRYAVKSKSPIKLAEFNDLKKKLSKQTLDEILGNENLIITSIK